METGIHFLFNLPYHPVSNPIEKWFANLKQRCKHVNTKNHEDLAEEVI